jgi:hypothetical protein
MVIHARRGIEKHVPPAFSANALLGRIKLAQWDVEATSDGFRGQLDRLPVTSHAIYQGLPDEGLIHTHHPHCALWPAAATAASSPVTSIAPTTRLAT